MRGLRVMVAGCTPLRRSSLSVVMGPFTFLPTALAALFIVMSFFDVQALYFAVPCGLVAVFPLFRPLRLCGDTLVVPRAIFREFRQPVTELVAIEVGTFRWSGYNGYKGWALVLHTPNERRLVYHSLYCSRRRLMTWASTIRGSDVFVGELRTTNRQERWGGPHNYPVV